MAVLQMQRISIYALRKNRKPILEWIQRCGAVEINDVLEEDSVFRRIDMTAQKTRLGDTPVPMPNTEVKP